MNKCKNCRKSVDVMNMMICPTCGANFCMNCADDTQRICPYCYSSLQYTD